MKRIAIIGSTGSIGVQALDVIRHNPDKLEVVALAAGRNARLLAEQAAEFNADYAAISYPGSYEELKSLCHCWTGQGMEAVTFLTSLEDVDLVLVAVSGAAGIYPTYKAVAAGKTVGLANKESLVAAGEVIMPLAQATGATILPVDSEHSAIFQCLQGEEKWISRIWLTASGGPFREIEADKLEFVTPEEALRHPKWNMGKKITIDSATLMNKGLEVIEAHHLFAVSYDQISVVIHPQSIVHSLVEFLDGSLLGHFGVPDMRMPIQYAFSYPERWETVGERLDLGQLGELQFSSPDLQKFPALDLALAAGRQGGTMPAVMNAANEIAVESFLEGTLNFTGIVSAVEKVMGQHQVINNPDLPQIMAADTWAREACIRFIKE
ncbi:MAG: 1-deoxy-D-xylulose-5-phosphate reductoisomerase [Syntrophomonadales bacterium]